MRTITFGEVVLTEGHAVVSTNRETHNVAVCFTSSDLLQNGACIHMAPCEAKKLAMQLIIYANKLDPVE
jgi:hypothetical protein